MRLNKLQNSISYMGDTVLQPTDRQRVAETLLFHTTSCHLQSIYADYQSFAIEGGCWFFPPSVYFHWISPHCYWRWQIWEELFNLLLYSGQQNTKHPEFYYEPDSGSPLKVCVYINCILAEAWPSDIFPSDGHAAFCLMVDYKAVTF